VASNDPLAQFRRVGAAPPAESHGPAPYKAYSAARDRPVRLDIRTVELAYAPLYGSLTNITYDPADYTGIFLTFNFNLLVKIDGRNLRPVVECLKLNTCEFLEEFSKRYAAPDADAPIIEHITIHTGRAGGEKA